MIVTQCLHLISIRCNRTFVPPCRITQLYLRKSDLPAVYLMYTDTECPRINGLVLNNEPNISESTFFQPEFTSVHRDENFVTTIRRLLDDLSLLKLLFYLNDTNVRMRSISLLHRSKVRLSVYMIVPLSRERLIPQFAIIIIM